MCDDVSTEFPHLTPGNFESCLASDGVLVNFFNDFLNLPCFSEGVLYNQDTGLFELGNKTAETISRKITIILKSIKAELFGSKNAALTKHTPVDNHYTVFELDGEQGIQWIKREKLPFFLHSDCYYEYRLVKRLLQQDPKLSSCRSKSRSISSLGRNVFSSPAFQHFSEFTHEDAELTSDQQENTSDEDIQEDPEDQCESYYQISDPAEQQLEDVVDMMEDLDLVNTEESVIKSKDQNDFSNTESENEVYEDWDEKNKGSKVKNQEYPSDFCWDDMPHFNTFKEFLHGTQGEKLLDLWMDIERLKAVKHKERKNRHLVVMRSWYLLRSSRSSLNMEMLSRLGLTTSPCWTEERLLSVQPLITQSLLCYWANLFWTSYRVYQYTDDFLNTGRQEVYHSPVWTFGSWSEYSAPTTPRSDTCAFHRPDTTHSEWFSTRVRSVYSINMQKILDVLFSESRSGSYFTRFCEQSGNQLWVDAVYLWTDMQRYHQLFQQDELDPYTIQREAQLLYSTYICSFARRSVDMEEELRMEVYHRMLPPFEELFDRVEDHVLNILLEAWMVLVSRDKESLQQIWMQEKVRCINNQEFRELQRLYEESERRLRQMKESETEAYFAEHSQALDFWHSISSGNYSSLLGPLVGEGSESLHFMSFLQSQGASIHLTCWLDLEQYRRTSEAEEATRKEKWSRIVLKYLNKRYFFGPNSPATEEQQKHILSSAGGVDNLMMGCLPDSLIVEIQDIVKAYIEETCLPLYISTAKYPERMKRKSEPTEGFMPHMYRRQRHRREGRKGEGLWLSTSKEVLLFRRFLLNPATCQQYQDFVSLKGDFLENDLRFWVEVQKYKDLCHSHCDEATIQQKISTIISCFINSAMPPPLQIDIPQEQAQRILEKRNELGPYIFREAQMSVFGELLKFWGEFQKFSSSMGDEDILSHLQEKRVKYRAKQQRQRRKEEEEEEENWRRQQDQNEQERSGLCIAEVDDEEKELKERQAKALLTARIKAPTALTQTAKSKLSQSYSKYMAGLRREEVLLKKESHLMMSSPTLSESSSDISIKSARN